MAMARLMQYLAAALGLLSLIIGPLLVIVPPADAQGFTIPADGWTITPGISPAAPTVGQPVYFWADVSRNHALTQDVCLRINATGLNGGYVLPSRSTYVVLPAELTALRHDILGQELRTATWNNGPSFGYQLLVGFTLDVYTMPRNAVCGPASNPYYAAGLGSRVRADTGTVSRYFHFQDYVPPADDFSVSYVPTTTASGRQIQAVVTMRNSTPGSPLYQCYQARFTDASDNSELAKSPWLLIPNSSGGRSWYFFLGRTATTTQLTLNVNLTVTRVDRIFKHLGTSECSPRIDSGFGGDKSVVFAPAAAALTWQPKVLDTGEYLLINLDNESPEVGERVQVTATITDNQRPRNTYWCYSVIVRTRGVLRSQSPGQLIQGGGGSATFNIELESQEPEEDDFVFEAIRDPLGRTGSGVGPGVFCTIPATGFFIQDTVDKSIFWRPRTADRDPEYEGAPYIGPGLKIIGRIEFNQPDENNLRLWQLHFFYEQVGGGVANAGLENIRYEVFVKPNEAGSVQGYEPPYILTRGATYPGPTDADRGEMKLLWESASDEPFSVPEPRIEIVGKATVGPLGWPTIVNAARDEWGILPAGSTVRTAPYQGNLFRLPRARDNEPVPGPLDNIGELPRNAGTLGGELGELQPRTAFMEISSLMVDSLGLYSRDESLTDSEANAAYEQRIGALAWQLWFFGTVGLTVAALAGGAALRGLSPLSLGLGALIFTLGWSVGGPLFGFMDWGLAVLPIVIWILLGLWVAQRRGVV